jgi:hypothetical protein
MAIYPVVKGQKFRQKNVIPPRASLSDLNARTKEPHGDEHDLIDFGDDSPAAQHPSSTEQPQDTGNSPPLDPSHRSTAEIQEMLSSTGTRTKEGPLIDFHEDMQKDLPSSIKRTDSTESDDEFVDAQG